MWEQQLIKTDRGTFEVFVKGEGDPICVTHLYSEYNSNGNRFANPFTAHYKVYLVNLRGAGNSDPVDSVDQLRMEETVEDLEGIRSALGLEFWSFAGYSAGGMLGLLYALHYPQSLSQLIVCGAAASYKYTQHPQSIFSRKNEKNGRVQEILKVLNDPNASMEERVSANREWSQMFLYRPEKLDEYFTEPDSGSSVPKLLQHFSYTEVRRFDLTERLEEISVPTFVLAGLHDAGCPIDCCKEIAEKIPGAQLVVFEESNHAPYVEEPERFAQAIKECYLHKPN